MNIKLAFLGTGTCNLSIRNPQSLALSNGRETVLIDCGGGCYHQLARLHDPFFGNTINLIILTHFHIDHVSGLLDFFWGEMYNIKGERTTPLTIIGPPGLNSFYTNKLRTFLGNKEIPFAVKLVELQNGDSFQHDFFMTTAHVLKHGEESTGYLLDINNTLLAISGDTGYCEKLVALLQKADVAIMEWSDSWESNYPEHISNTDMLRLLEENAIPERMYIIHMYLKDHPFNQQVEINKQLLGIHAERFFFPADLDVIEI